MLGGPALSWKARKRHEPHSGTVYHEARQSQHTKGHARGREEPSSTHNAGQSTPAHPPSHASQRASARGRTRSSWSLGCSNRCGSAQGVAGWSSHWARASLEDGKRESSSDGTAQQEAGAQGADQLAQPGSRQACNSACGTERQLHWPVAITPPHRSTWKYCPGILHMGNQRSQRGLPAAMQSRALPHPVPGRGREGPQSLCPLIRSRASVPVGSAPSPSW